jgi:AcrR family transcriptional regulator
VARPGRRPGSTRTREAILAAARERFARHGYDRTTIRAIAADAEVDPGLVMHFFPTKERVFEAVMELPPDVERALGGVLEGDAAGVGERLVRMFLDVWDDPATGAAMAGLLRSAASYEAAADRFRAIFGERLIGRLAGVAVGPDAALRADLVSTQLVGLALMRYVVRVEPLASAGREQVVAAVAPVLQRYLTGVIS